MAKEASLYLLFLSFLTISSSGALVSFSYLESGDSATSAASGTISFHLKSKVSPSQIRILVADHRILSTLTNPNVSVDFYINKTLVENFVTSEKYGLSWLNAHLVHFLPQVDIKSIILSCSSECLSQKGIPSFLTALKSSYSLLSKLHLGREVKVSVAFPLSFLEKLNASYEHNLLKILSFTKEIKSFVMIEDNIDRELSTGEDHFVESICRRAALAAYVLPCKDVPIVLTIKSLVIPSSMEEVPKFSKRVSKNLEARIPITRRIVALYVEVHTTEDFAQKELKRRTLDDTTNPPNTVFPTNPTSATPIITPPDTPTIITVPSNNPVTISPTNPAAKPVTVSPTTTVPLTPTNPTNSPVPVTNPAAQPVTNPVTSSYPPPSGSVPVVNPLPPPSNTNGAPPAISGQSWCVAKNGAAQTALQSALDYACGMGGADCSQIQQGGNCYNPNSLQNHASYAFNSYYQKNPAPTSCDFGGTATLVNTNPSSGSCVYSSSASTSSSSSTPTLSPPATPTTSIPSPTPPPATPSTNPTTSPTTPPTPSVPTTTTPPTTSSSSGAGPFGYGTPPSVLNSSNPASGITPVLGSDSPPVANDTDSSHSVGLRPYVGCMVLVISLVAGRLSP